MEQPYQTQLSTGDYMLFTARCLCEAKWKQSQFHGRYLKLYPIEDYEVRMKINKGL